MVVGLSGQQPIERVLHVDEDVEVVPHGTADKREQVGGAVARLDVTDEKPDGMTFSEKMLLGLSRDSRKALTRRRNAH